MLVNPGYGALVLAIIVLHDWYVAWLWVDFIVVISDQVYKGFTIELEGLKVCVQEKSYKQDNESSKC